MSIQFFRGTVTGIFIFVLIAGAVALFSRKKTKNPNLWERGFYIWAYLFYNWFAVLIIIGYWMLGSNESHHSLFNQLSGIAMVIVSTYIFALYWGVPKIISRLIQYLKKPRQLSLPI